MAEAAGTPDRGGATRRRASRWRASRWRALGVAMVLFPPAPTASAAGDPEPVRGHAAPAHGAVEALRRELAGARREIEALRATGAEMQLSLEARDAALAELRGRTAEMLAGALERADRLTAERDEARRRLDEALERIAVLEGEAVALAAPATDSAPDPVADGLAAAKAKHVPAPLPKPPQAPPPGDPGSLSPDTGPVLRAAVNDGAEPLDGAASPLNRVQARLAELPGVEAVGEGRYVLAASPLFAPGQAALSQRGRADLRPMADRLRRWLADLPPGTAWRLHVDGHADDASARQGAFASGLELSRARAGAVASYLAARGLPAERLSANGLAGGQLPDATAAGAARGPDPGIELRLTAE
jgi:chemotaxis protein MotB